MEETYSFSTALRMMRYGGKKMKSKNWKSERYAFVKDDLIFQNNNGLIAPIAISSQDIMGSWVEVKE